jgi:hypothetical protein
MSRALDEAYRKGRGTALYAIGAIAAFSVAWVGVYAALYGMATIVTALIAAALYLAVVPP